MIRRPRQVWPLAVRNAARALLGRRAGVWLSSPNSSFGGLTPLTLAGDRTGAERVIAELARTRSRMPRSIS